MPRVPMDFEIRARSGPTVPGIRLYVFDRGTTNEVSVYDDDTAGSVITQPLLSDAEGRVPDAWVAGGSYDLYSPDDVVEPTQPWEAVTGVDMGSLTVIREAPVNVQDPRFGAVGDAGVTDNSTALQEAIDHVETAGDAGELFFPLGRYGHETGLRVKKGIKIVGSGWGEPDPTANILATPGTSLIWTGVDNGTDPMLLLKAETSGDTIFNPIIEDIGFEGENTAYQGVRAESTALGRFNFAAERCRSHGFILTDGNGALYSHNRIPFYAYNAGANAAARYSNGLSLMESDVFGGTNTTVDKLLMSMALGIGLEIGDHDTGYFAHVASGGDAQPYTTGTVDVTLGSAVVTGTGTDWLPTIVPGLVFKANKRAYIIESVDSDTQITLAAPYAEATVTGDAYEIQGHGVVFRTTGSGTPVQSRSARKNVIGYLNARNVHFEGDGTGDSSRSNHILAANSEGVTFTQDVAGASFHYTIHDRDHGDLFYTHRYKMSDRLEVPLALGRAQLNTPTRTEIGTDDYEVISFPASGTTTVWGLAFRGPYDWNHGLITGVEILWATSTSTATTVRLTAAASCRAAGESTSVGTTSLARTIAVPAAADVLTADTFTFATPVAFTRDDLIQFSFTRNDASGADTYGGTVYLASARLLYSSDGPDSDGAGRIAIPLAYVG